MVTWLMTFFGGLGLRLKLYAVAAGVLVLAIGYFFLKWKLLKGKQAEERLKQVEATRSLERTILKGQEKLKARQAKVREQILARKERDYFER